MRKTEYSVKVYFLKPFSVEEMHFLKVEDNGEILLVKEAEATVMFEKEKVDAILLDFFHNREKYKEICKGSSYLSVKVVLKKETETYGWIESYGDSLTIKF